MFTALGATMGLGNVLRFPGLCAMHGGGAFIIAYAVMLVFVCYPILCAELRLGKRGSLSPVCRTIFFIASLNSALVAVYYAFIVARLAKCTVTVPLGISGIDTPSLGVCAQSLVLALILGIVWGLTCFSLKGGGVSATAKFSVLLSLVLLVVTALRGCAFKNAPSALSALFVPRYMAFNDLSLWIDAFGQALLSLSLCGGVMPSFAQKLEKGQSVKGCAVTILFFNFLGCVLSSVALFTCLYGCGMEGEILHASNGFFTAFVIYPKVFASLFLSKYACTVFSLLFYGTITVVAYQSCLSLITPLHGRINEPFCLCIICALLSSLFCLPFGEELFTLVDKWACAFVAPVICAVECAYFAFCKIKRRTFRYASSNYI